MLASFLVRHEPELQSMADKVTGCPLYASDGWWRLWRHEHGACGGTACAGVAEDLQRLIRPVALASRATELASDAVSLCAPGGPGVGLMELVRRAHSVRAFFDVDLIVEGENGGVRMPVWLSLTGVSKDNVLAAVDEAWPALREAITERGGRYLEPRSRQGLVQRPERDLAFYLRHHAGANPSAISRWWQDRTDRWRVNGATASEEADPEYREWRARWAPSFPEAAAEECDESTVADSWRRAERCLRAT